jgi:hypothetical protein
MGVWDSTGNSKPVAFLTKPVSTLRRYAPPPDGLRNALRAKNATAAAAGGVIEAGSVTKKLA